MKRFCIGIILILIITSAFSQNTKQNIYSGGMLILQPGYTIAENNHQAIEDISFGIGGILRFYFGKFLTAGIYGGTLRANYNSSNSQNSYINLGYGGPFIGFSYRSKKIRYTASAFVGGGNVKNLHIESQENNLLIDSYLYKYSTLIFSPILSLDYAITQRLMLTMQTVCLRAKYDDEKILYSPIFQLGILFNR